MRFVACLFAIAALMAARRSAAQVMATDAMPPPEQRASAQVATPPQPSPRLPMVPSAPDRVDPGRGPGTVWYGDEILYAAAATSTLTLVGGLVLAPEGDNPAPEAAVLVGMGMLAHFVSGPAIHGAYGLDWRVPVSVATRTTLGIGVPLVTALACDQQGGCEHPVAVLAGALAVGTLVPAAIDAAIAWRPAERRHRARGAHVVPWMTPTEGGGHVGVAGTF